MLKHHTENKSSNNTIQLLFAFQMVCNSSVTIVAFIEDHFIIVAVVPPKSYFKHMK